jgi:hypothetical protein
MKGTTLKRIELATVGGKGVEEQSRDYPLILLLSPRSISPDI